MKKTKRLVSFITATAFLLSSVAPAMAGTVGSDVVGTKYATSVNKLAAIGVLTGYADGTVKVDQTITRAEFAAMVTRELGLGNASAGSATKFKDVPASHWASGVINLAVGQGILKGYPDGTFKPEKEVTHAEAIAMLVRMLGYEPSVKGGAWPTAYLSKGASIGVTDGVSVNADSSAKRGDIFRMAANSLEIDMMEQTGWGTDVVYAVEADKTILSDKFDIEISDEKSAGVNWKVDKTPSIGIGSLDADEVELNDNNTYTVKGNFDANQFLGQEVDIWYNKDDKEIFFMEPKDDQTVLVDTVDSLSATNIHLTTDDSDYTINSATYAYVNYLKVTDTNANGIGDEVAAQTNLIDKNVKVVVDADDNVLFMEIVDFATDKAAVVDKVNGEKIDFYDDNTATKTTLDLDGEDYVLVKDGAKAEVKDLKQGDVVNYFAEANGYYLVASSTKVEGKVESVKFSSSALSGLDIYVGGKKYDVGKYATYSDDKNDTISLADTTDVKDLTGVTVSMYIDAFGKIKHIVAGEESKAQNVAVLSANAAYDTFTKEYRLEFVNQASTDVSFNFELDDVVVKYWNGTAYVEDTNEAVGGIGGSANNKINTRFANLASGANSKVIAVEYKLDSAGKLDEVKVLNLTPATLTDAQIVEDDNIIDLNGFKNVVDDSLIFDVTAPIVDGEIADIEKVTWDGIKDQSGMTVAYTTDSDDVEYLFVTTDDGSSLGGSTAKYGVVTGFGVKGDDDTVVVLDADGNVNEYVYDNISLLDKGDAVKYDLDANGDVDTAKVITNYDAYGQYTAATPDADIENLTFLANVDDISSTRIKDGATQIVVNANTVYYDITDDANKKVSGADENQMVIGIDTDDDDIAANYVIIIDNDTTDLENPAL